MLRMRVLVGLAVVLGLVAVLAALSRTGVGSTLEGMTGLGPDCSVTSCGADEERAVALSREAAESTATAAAAAVRAGDGRARAAVRSAAADSGATLTTAEVAVVTDALTGRSRGALTCASPDAPGEESDALDPRGLTARAAQVRSDLLAVFGRQRLGGYAPGGVSTGHMEGSAHYEGRAIDVFYRPMTPAQKQRGWAVAQYLVAHAERLGVRTVIYDARIWSAWRASQGWRPYAVDTAGRPASVADVLLHRDHVHVDVAD